MSRSGFVALLLISVVAGALAHTPIEWAQQPVGAEPSLQATMQFIQEKLNDIGKVNFIVTVQNTATGDAYIVNHLYELSNVVAHINECHITYHWRAWTDGKQRDDGDGGFPLPDWQRGITERRLAKHASQGRRHIGSLRVDRKDDPPPEYTQDRPPGSNGHPPGAEN